MSLIELLLLGILIMLIVLFHYNASVHGRYAKLFDILVHRPTKYAERKTVVLCKAGFCKGKVNYCRVKDKIREVKHGR